MSIIKLMQATLVDSLYELAGELVLSENTISLFTLAGQLIYLIQEIMTFCINI
jgi:hypothetical protein